MALKFKRGDIVRQVVPVITGRVADHVIIDGDVQYVVDYADAEGNLVSRPFTEVQLELRPEQA